MNMESMTIHAAGLPRRYPASIQVASIGWVPAKKDRIHRRFNTYNFSVILSGTGIYRIGNQDIPIKAPAVITQRPELMHYGPTEQWSELFFIFPPEFIDGLRAEKLWQDDSWWWPLNTATTIQPEVNTLLALMENMREDKASRRFTADKIDRLAIQIILECRLQQGEAQNPSDHNEAIQAVQSVFERNYQQHHHIDDLARQHNLSPTHFRRLWQQQIGSSPQQYLHQLRMRSAARMLATGQLAIQDIAQAVGYDDPLYFSKRFRSFFHMSPTEYRFSYREIHQNK